MTIRHLPLYVGIHTYFFHSSNISGRKPLFIEFEMTRLFLGFTDLTLNSNSSYIMLSVNEKSTILVSSFLVKIIIFFLHVFVQNDEGIDPIQPFKILWVNYLY